MTSYHIRKICLSAEVRVTVENLLKMLIKNNNQKFNLPYYEYCNRVYSKWLRIATILGWPCLKAFYQGLERYIKKILQQATQLVYLWFFTEIICWVI